MPDIPYTFGEKEDASKVKPDPNLWLKVFNWVKDYKEPLVIGSMPLSLILMLALTIGFSVPIKKEKEVEKDRASISQPYQLPEVPINEQGHVALPLHVLLPYLATLNERFAVWDCDHKDAAIVAGLSEIVCYLDNKHYLHLAGLEYFNHDEDLFDPVKCNKRALGSPVEKEYNRLLNRSYVYSVGVFGIDYPLKNPESLRFWTSPYYDKYLDGDKKIPRELIKAERIFKDERFDVNPNWVDRMNKKRTTLQQANHDKRIIDLTVGGSYHFASPNNRKDVDERLAESDEGKSFNVINIALQGHRLQSKPPPKDFGFTVTVWDKDKTFFNTRTYSDTPELVISAPTIDLTMRWEIVRGSDYIDYLSKQDRIKFTENWLKLREEFEQFEFEKQDNTFSSIARSYRMLYEIAVYQVSDDLQKRIKIMKNSLDKRISDIQEHEPYGFKKDSLLDNCFERLKACEVVDSLAAKAKKLAAEYKNFEVTAGPFIERPVKER